MLVFHNQLWHKEDFVIYKENTEVSIGLVRGGYGLPTKKTPHSYRRESHKKKIFSKGNCLGGFHS